MAKRKRTFRIVRVNPASPPRGNNPYQVSDPQVVQWCREIYAGRVPEVTRLPVVSIHSNPYVLNYVDEDIEAVSEEIRAGGEMADELSWLVVARLPNGGFVDVDTPYPYEAVKRGGITMVKATIVGTFTESDCRRIGIPTQYPQAAGEERA